VRLESKRLELRTLLADATRTSAAFQNRDMPQAVARDWSAKIEEADKLSHEIKRMQHVIPAGPKHEFPPGPLPLPGQSPKERKRMDKSLTPGQAFTESGVYGLLKSDGWPRTSSPKVEVPSFATKAVPTISVSDATTFSVVAPARDPDIVRTSEYERLRLRDVVTNASTSGDSVQFVRVVSDRPDTATGVAPTVEKPESTIELDVASVPVRTLTVWMPVTEQQLEDVSQLRSVIDTELRFDLSRLEEYQIVWGSGGIFLGIMETPNVNAFTRTLDLGAGSTETLLDKIRGAISDVVVDGHMADTVALHPYDAEVLSTSKGSDDHYLNQVFPTQAGGLRLWSLKVVETLAMESYRDGLGTHQRVVMVGDFQRGATLWDRHKASVEVGYIDKQFVENVRTIRAETREAFAVKRPSAFRYIETVAAGT
jgi:HK97 family phage major capsid protein